MDEFLTSLQDLEVSLQHILESMSSSNISKSDSILALLSSPICQDSSQMDKCRLLNDIAYSILALYEASLRIRGKSPNEKLSLELERVREYNAKFERIKPSTRPSSQARDFIEQVI